MPKVGRTLAADPSVLPLGSIVYVSCPDFPSVDGYYVVEDTGKKVRGRIIDIFFPSSKSATLFGRRVVYVYILEEGAVDIGSY